MTDSCTMETQTSNQNQHGTRSSSTGVIEGESLHDGKHPPFSQCIVNSNEVSSEAITSIHAEVNDNSGVDVCDSRPLTNTVNRCISECTIVFISMII